MAGLEAIRQDHNMVNDIDWEMTPEEAIVLYLEWGNNWSHGRMIKSKDDVSHYFIINTWGEVPKVTFIRRNTEGAEELAEFNLPDELGNRFMASVKNKKGVWGLDEDVKKWLQGELRLN
jgi:hypothetical protein